MAAMFLPPDSELHHNDDHDDGDDDVPSLSHDQVHKHVKDKEELIRLPRKTLRKKVSLGEYCPSDDTVTVKQQKGSHWSNIGHWDNGRTVLYPEEVIYGMESGFLAITDQSTGSWWTTQQAYHFLLSGEHNDHLLSFTQVFMYLKRAGAIVRRRNIASSDVDILRCHGYQYSLVLDVYKCQPKVFKKSSPGPPTCVVLMARPRDSFPTPTEVDAIATALAIEPQHSQLKYAIVDSNQNITLHSVYWLTSLQPTTLTTSA